MTRYLYRGVNAELYAKLNGVLQPKVQRGLYASPRWGQAEWDNADWGESANNAVIEHQHHQAGLPTSGISTTLHLAQAIAYATHDGKYSKGYVFVINRSLCEGLKVAEFVVNQVVPYRPNKGALDAVDKLTVKLQFGQYNFVVEADIQGFFDNLDQDALVEMLSRRIGDRQLLRLIQKWLKAGVLNTDGSVTHPLTGTPQGGIVSPILANVYLHYTLDLWFQEVVQWHTKGEACLIRYADDFVCGFEHQDEAQHFYGALEHRLEKFGLQLAAAKSRVIPFSRNGEPGNTRFDFLGFEFSWGKDRVGKPHLKRRTSRKKFRNSLANFTAWCKQSRHVPLRELFPLLKLKLRGYYNYYGVSGNSNGLKEFFDEAMGTLWKWLNRRSQCRSFTRQGFDDLLEHFQVPRPRITARPRVPFRQPAFCS